MLLPMSCFPCTCHLPCLCPVMHDCSYFLVQEYSVGWGLRKEFLISKAPNPKSHHGTLSMAANGPLAFRNSSTVPFSITVPWMGAQFAVCHKSASQQLDLTSIPSRLARRHLYYLYRGGIFWHTPFEDCFKEPASNTTTWSKFMIVSWDHQNANMSAKPGKHIQMSEQFQKSQKFLVLRIMKVKPSQR